MVAMCGFKVRGVLCKQLMIMLLAEEWKLCIWACVSSVISSLPLNVLLRFPFSQVPKVGAKMIFYLLYYGYGGASRNDGESVQWRFKLIGSLLVIGVCELSLLSLIYLFRHDNYFMVEQTAETSCNSFLQMVLVCLERGCIASCIVSESIVVGYRNMTKCVRLWDREGEGGARDKS